MKKEDYTKVITYLDFQAKGFTIVEDESEEKDLVIEGYANTVAKDRGGDVVLASAWKTQNALTNFKKNPVLLAFHDHSKPIGTVVEAEPTELGLKVVAKISKAAGALYELVKDGVLRTFSIGFRVHDARYEPDTDTFYITDLELYECSVVSVPMNQDSTFQVRKSLGSYFEDIKNISSSQKDNKGNQMTPEELQALLTKAANDAVKAQAEEAARLEAARVAEANAKAAFAEQAKAAALEAAASLIGQVQAKMNASAEEFTATIKKLEDQILAQKDEIAQVLAAQKSNRFEHTSLTDAIKGNPSKEEVKAIENAFLLGLATQKDVFATKLGAALKEKAVNSSSSFQVSSEAYETVFSTNLIRDIEHRLVIAPLFQEITLSAANLTIPVIPGRTYATWVNSSNYGTTNSTGNEITGALTEFTLKTFKLAGKSYLTDETNEDALIAMLPLIRERLVTAHVATIERDFLRGNGVAVPVKGLTQMATDDSKVIVTTAKADGTVKVTAEMLHKARRSLGLKGLEIGNLVVLVSMDAYYDLLEDANFQDMDKVGELSIKRTGQVGRLYGLPVMICGEFEAKAVSKPFAVIAYTPDIVVPRQRGATVQTDYDVERQRRVIVATQRLNIDQLFPNGVVSLTYAAT